MELDEISTTARRVAAAFDMSPPQVEAGRTARWSPTGVSLRERGGSLVLIIGPQFHTLQSADADAALAEICAGYKIHPRTFRRLGLAFLALLAFLVIAMSLANFQTDVPGWGNVLGVGLLLVGWLLILVPWLRWFTYQIDREIFEALGWPVVHAALDFDRRNPLKVPLRWLTPGVATRRNRLATRHQFQPPVP
ncbi:hypothetical protein [Actinomadura rudentiformis]|uniref:Uncharacterized protein n=1 Tax=Actinomadura rudentiformis TaxID=359158 RepID=A0A6H9YRW3_9ACTN|nr:hypothetical protein [Actinomadura rudentiformis]KAB2348011.1 hypothetical protein F8566_19255 [Actinomadura rudentiformis]